MVDVTVEENEYRKEEPASFSPWWTLISRICTSPIIHLVWPQKFCITFVFYFSSVLQPSQKELTTTLEQNFGEQTRCILEDVQVTSFVIFKEETNLFQSTGVDDLLIPNFVKFLTKHNILFDCSWKNPRLLGRIAHFTTNLPLTIRNCQFTEHGHQQWGLKIKDKLV